ncbi:multicopper oxidase domain-containing protein [Halorubrum sp. DTA46]|uniref:multicopper oxidase domain-containing protein n=1 Tax=Halorubrum sp. DTA46 TaxID=3402162 RepID=UPI003AB062A7
MYEGQFPGPELRVQEGDVLSVELTNDLREETTIHWHGVPVPNPVEGVPNVTQYPVASGDTFTYKVRAERSRPPWSSPSLVDVATTCTVRDESKRRVWATDDRIVGFHTLCDIGRRRPPDRYRYQPSRGDRGSEVRRPGRLGRPTSRPRRDQNTPGNTTYTNADVTSPPPTR